MSHITNTEKDTEQMIISALRYALPRKSYIMSSTEEYITKFIKGGVSEWFLNQVIMDIDDEENQRNRFEKDNLQHDWSKLKALASEYLSNYE